MLCYSVSYDKVVCSICMLCCKIPTEMDECLVVFTLRIENLYAVKVTNLVKHILWRIPSALHVLVLMPCCNKFTYTRCTHIKPVAIVGDYCLNIIAHFASLIEHIEHDASVKQVSHRLQVCEFSNHLMEFLLFFGRKWSPSMLFLVIIRILKPGKPAGSARVLICCCCHHN